MRTWTPMQWFIAIIVICAAVAILYIAIPAMGIVIPPAIAQIIWIVIIAFTAIVAIGLLIKWWQSWGDGSPPSP